MEGLCVLVVFWWGEGWGPHAGNAVEVGIRVLRFGFRICGPGLKPPNRSKCLFIVLLASLIFFAKRWEELSMGP